MTPDKKIFSSLVSPKDGSPLEEKANALRSGDNRDYPIINGVADILDPDLQDAALLAELSVFEEELPIEGLSYYEPVLFQEAVRVMGDFLSADAPDPVFVEIGGGEGFLARAFHKAFPQGTTYVCDLSMRNLSRAPEDLVRVRCDVRQPYLLPHSVDVAAFWVSLHHFSEKDASLALDQAARIMKPGGLLVLFEPNARFLPRQVLLNTFLKKFVYYDEEEKALDFARVSAQLLSRGFSPVFATGHNPPYNLKFLKALTRFWPAFWAATQIPHALERLAGLGKTPWWTPKASPQVSRLFLGSYFFSLFRHKG